MGVVVVVAATNGQAVFQTIGGLFLFYRPETTTSFVAEDGLNLVPRRSGRRFTRY